MSAPLIQFQDVSKVYRTGRIELCALRDITLSFHRGEFWAIMGPSGSGKSTMLNLLGCLDRPTGGECLLRGTDTATLDDDSLSQIRLNEIGFIFQSFNLVPQLTVLENIEMPLYYLGRESAVSIKRASELAESVGLGDRLHHRPTELSGGERQRAAVARALANDPAVILADEPTGNLDTRTGAQIMALLDGLHRDGRTILMVTHEHDVAERAQKTLHLRDGRIERIETRSGGGCIGVRTIRILRNIRLGIKSLLLHKMRALLTTLGVVFGVSSVIAMLSVGEGASRDALAQIRKLGSQNIIIRSIKPISEENNKESRTRMIIYGLKRDDEARIRESFDTVARIVPVRLMRRQARMEDRSCELRVVGTTADWFTLVRRDVLAGRMLRVQDVREHANVCVLTEHGVRQLLPASYVLGETVMLGDTPFTVVGVVQTEEGNTTVQIPDESIDAYVPITSALDRYGEMNVDSGSGSFNMELVELHQLLVEVDALEHVESTAAGIEAMLKRFHKEEDYQLSVPLSLLREAEATKRRFSIVLGSIAGISLLVGGIGIMNIMLATVTERTREIGIRRAIGARRGQIVQQFLVETIVLSGSGGIVGTIMGILIPWTITRLSGMPTVVTSGSVILALGISMTVGLVFGLYPAVRAARLDPIEALRHE